MTAMGPSLPAELAAAGLAGLPFDIDMATGAVTDHGLSEANRTKLDAVIAAHDRTKPAAPPSCTRLGLKRAFTELGVWPQVKAMIDGDEELKEEWELAVDINRADPLVQQAVAGLAQAGVPMDDDALTMLMVRANDLVGVPRIGVVLTPETAPTA